MTERVGDQVAGGLGAHLGWVWGENLLNFQVKNAGFYAFLLRKNYTCGQKPGTRGLNQPLGG